jgi:hypothetical protein
MKRFLASLALICVLIPALPGAAKSGQKHFDRDKGKPRESFEVRWRDGDNNSHEVAFQLNHSAVVRDLEADRKFPRSDAVDAQVKAVRKYAKTLDDVKVTAKASGGGVRIKAKGTSRAKIKKALKGAEKVQEEALEEFLADNDYIQLKGDAISFDHATLVSEYADDVRAVARALAEGTDSEREYAERALSFVQAIPYEKKKSGGDVGYRRPLAVLARNKGDCDSKAVLYLALLRIRNPELAVSVVYIKDHMLVGVGLDAESGDRTFRRDGQTYLFAEPVGPAMTALGDSPKKNRSKVKSGAAQVRAAPARQGAAFPRPPR